MRATPSLQHLDAGRTALAAGAWQQAQHAFAQALAIEETAPALEGLGLAAWWLDLAEVVFDSRERAYRAYRAQDDPVSAARLAVWLAWDSAAFRGESAVASGWLQRARRLLQGRPDSAEHAFLAERAAVFALLDEGDPEEAERLAAEAIRIGQAVGIIDHEMVGRALHGFARVTMGRVTEGLRELDEVSAAILAGEMSDRLLVGLAGCYLIAACDRVRDHGRAVQWCDRIKEHSRKWGLKPLFAVCRTQYASVCMWRGAWEEAERELTSACTELAICRPGMTTDGLARLGELRRRQGRLEEAAALFDRSAPHPIASLGRTALALDHGDPRNAAEMAERHLRKLPPKNRTERGAALELLVRARAASGREEDLVAARAALDELDGIAADTQTAPLLAAARHAAGLIALAAGEHDTARRNLEDAVDLFERSGAPFETARARLDLASVLERLDRSGGAVTEVNRALEGLTSLGATLAMTWATAQRDRLASSMTASVPASMTASMTASMPGSAGRAAPAAASPAAAPATAPPATASPATASAPSRDGGLTAREIEVLRLISSGLGNQAIAERLFISEHTVHRHVANTLAKLSVPSRSAAVAQAARLGLL